MAGENILHPETPDEIVEETVEPTTGSSGSRSAVRGTTGRRGRPEEEHVPAEVSAEPDIAPEEGVVEESDKKTPSGMVMTRCPGTQFAGSSLAEAGKGVQRVARWRRAPTRPARLRPRGRWSCRAVRSVYQQLRALCQSSNRRPSVSVPPVVRGEVPRAVRDLPEGYQARPPCSGRSAGRTDRRAEARAGAQMQQAFAAQQEASN
jgi:hypothetical protein